MDEVFPETKISAQLYFNEGMGYSEKNSCICDFSSDKEFITAKYNFEEKDHLESVRFDPMTMSGCVMMKYIKLIPLEGEELEITEYKHNASAVVDDKYVFVSEDPHFEIEIPKKRRYKELIVCYRVFLSLKQQEVNQLIIQQQEKMLEMEREKNNILEIKRNLEKGLSDLVNKHNLMKRKYEKELTFCKTENEKLNQELDSNIKFRELEYIKSTKAYKIFLKRKVEKYVV